MRSLMFDEEMNNRSFFIKKIDNNSFFFQSVYVTRLKLTIPNPALKKEKNIRTTPTTQ